MNKKCRCHTCKKDYKAYLRKKRDARRNKQHHELKPMPRMRGYDTMTLGEYNRERKQEVPKSAIRRDKWKRSAV